MTLGYINLDLAHRLRDRDFRKEWFRAELEADVPEKFRDLRELRELTQIELAELAHMKQSAISRFEKSRDANWKLETLIKLAEALDARLSINIEPAEVVIANYQRDETRIASPQKSILDAHKKWNTEVPTLNVRRTASGSLPTQHWNTPPLKPASIGPHGSVIKRGDRPWN